MKKVGVEEAPRRDASLRLLLDAAVERWISAKSRLNRLSLREHANLELGDHERRRPEAVVQAFSQLPGPSA